MGESSYMKYYTINDDVSEWTIKECETAHASIQVYCVDGRVFADLGCVVINEEEYFSEFETFW
jgi:hypothetical protein